MKHQHFFQLLFGFTPTTTDTIRHLEGYNKKRVISRSHKGNYLSEEGNLKESESLHTGVFGISGSGKTTKLLLCKLLALTKADRSIIVCDPGGDIYDITCGYLSSIGYRIRQLDFETTQSGQGYRYNPASRLDAKDPMSLLRVASILIDAVSSSKNEFWSALSKNLLVLLLEALVSDTQVQYDKTLQTLYEWLMMCQTDRQEELDAIVLKNLQNETSKNEYISFFQSQTEKVLMTTLSVCKSALYSAKPLKELLSSESIRFEECRAIPMVIYLKINEDRIKEYAFAVTLFYAQLFSFLMQLPTPGEPYLDVEILGDEMSSFKVPDLDQILSVIRRRKVKIMLIYQSISQISQGYGKEASDTILGNLSTLYILPGVGDATSDRISQMLGSYKTEQGHLQKVMSSRQVRMLEDGTALVIQGNHPAIILQKVRPWYTIRKYVSRSKQQKRGGVIE